MSVVAEHVLPEFVNPDADLSMAPERRLQAIIDGFSVVRDVLKQVVLDRHDLAVAEKALNRAFSTATRVAPRSDSRIEAFKASSKG